MSEEYLTAVRESWDMIEMLSRGLSDDYILIVTADHGGHGRNHGSDIAEDMTIPILCRGSELPDAHKDGGSILDIAPTVCALLGAAPDTDWEGSVLQL